MIFISTPFSRAGAIVGSLKNILVAHIEGGELSGTVDELIRHSVSKLSHIHFVSNSDAGKRLKQMGEITSSIFIIGSPDVDILFSENLPTLETAMKHYDITFDDFAISVFHPVTTEAKEMKNNVAAFVDALENDYHNYIIVFPNNDLGSQFIIQAYEKLKSKKRFNIFLSLRFEYFLTLLKNAQFIIGNSSSGIREAPYYGIPIINIGSRQQNRTINADIINVDYNYNAIFEALKNIDAHPVDNRNVNFGSGNSAELFLETLKNKNVWEINHQKQFRDS